MSKPQLFHLRHFNSAHKKHSKMKREGRQHGMVRTYPILASSWNPRPEPRYVNKFNSPPTAGLFTKVSQKPTNHSKFTGKCGRPKCASCHIHPACKAKVKAKGTQKLRSSDRLITLRTVGSGPILKFSGFSATVILDKLASDYIDHDDEVDSYDVDDAYEGSCALTCPELIIHSENSSPEIVEVDDYDEENMSFCNVGYVWEQVDGDEDWCIVEEM